MEIIVEPITEEQATAPTQPEANAEEIRDALIAKAQCCVDHLCGCR